MKVSYISPKFDIFTAPVDVIWMPGSMTPTDEKSRIGTLQERVIKVYPTYARECTEHFAKKRMDIFQFTPTDGILEGRTIYTIPTLVGRAEIGPKALWSWMKQAKDDANLAQEQRVAIPRLLMAFSWETQEGMILGLTPTMRQVQVLLYPPFEVWRSTRGRAVCASAEMREAIEHTWAKKAAAKEAEDEVSVVGG